MLKHSLVTGLKIKTRVVLQESKNHSRILVYCFECREVKPLGKKSFIKAEPECPCQKMSNQRVIITDTYKASEARRIKGRLTRPGLGSSGHSPRGGARDPDGKFRGGGI